VQCFLRMSRTILDMIDLEKLELVRALDGLCAHVASCPGNFLVSAHNHGQASRATNCGVSFVWWTLDLLISCACRRSQGKPHCSSGDLVEQATVLDLLLDLTSSNHCS
jgi:hypothetical protein